MKAPTKALRPVVSLALAVLFLIMAAAVPPSASSQSGSLKMRRVWKGDLANICCYVFPKPSPDGRYIPGVDWSTGDLAYLDLQEDRWIRVSDKGEWWESADFSMNSIFSPDGTQLAHTWLTDDGARGLFDIRVEDLNGENVRVIVPSTVSEYAWPLDWSADGRFILAALTEGEGIVEKIRLALVPADGGEIEVIKEYDTTINQGVFRARFSPDGQWIAYEEYVGDPLLSDIHLLSVDGRVDRGLVTGNGNDALMGWLPDGSGLLFHSERNLTQAIWRLPIQNGFPSGEPELVRGDVWGMAPMGFGPAGYYYVIRTEAPQVHTAALDLERGEIVSPPNPVRELTDGWSQSPSWSPDGRQLAFLDRGPLGGARPRLVIQTLETGETHTLAIPFDAPTRVHWVPDSRTITIQAEYKGVLGLYRFDLQSGEVKTLVKNNDLNGRFRFRLSRDGRTLFYPTRSVEGRVEVRERDLEAGSERTVATFEAYAATVVDFPDGRRYAVLIDEDQDRQNSQNRLLTMNSDGTGVRTLWEGPRGLIGSQQMEVTHDGKYILLGSREATEAPGGFFLLSFDAETGERRVIEAGPRGDSGAEMLHFSLHPDGSRIAFGRGAAKGEIWVMEGFWGR